MNDFFSTFELILDDKNFRATFLVYKDAFLTTTALYKDNDLLRNLLDDTIDSYHLSDQFMDLKISIDKEHQSQSVAVSTNKHQSE
ncbi:hypothetical protein RCL_jg6514.t1 [Rhizophagus clarus]|uniref:Uncharacterized protein n=1 Tax=Rhizophagus clarus TaxID=94130 RepID=A0A8H3LGX8_9GLOM|nr:hypothetical protein RCL_jg6514.t1 [Rhizophagus clarus]